MKFPYSGLKNFKSVQKNFDFLQGALGGFQKEVRGQAVLTSNGASAQDIVVTDNLPAAGKRGMATWDFGSGTFAADFIRISVVSYADGTTTFRVSSQGGGAITLGNTVAINYTIWR